MELYGIYVGSKAVGAIELPEGWTWGDLEQMYPEAHEVLDDVGFEPLQIRRIDSLDGISILDEEEIMDIWRGLAWFVYGWREPECDSGQGVFIDEDAAVRAMRDVWKFMTPEERVRVIDGAMDLFVETHEGIVADWTDLMPKEDIHALAVLVEDCVRDLDGAELAELAEDGPEYEDWLEDNFGKAGKWRHLIDLNECGYASIGEAYRDILEIIREMQEVC